MPEGAPAYSCPARAVWIPAFAGMTAKDTGRNDLSIQRGCPCDWEGDWRPLSGKSISAGVLRRPATGGCGVAACVVGEHRRIPAFAEMTAETPGIH